MTALPMKPEYGPTLGRLLAPRWQRASRAARCAVLLATTALLAVIVAAFLTLDNAHYSQGGRVPFSFSYRDLYRTAPDPGGYVKVQRRNAAGQLEESFAVNPLRLPAYHGEQSAEMPLFAASYIRALSRRDPGFELRGEGKTKVNGVPAYDILYTTTVEGRKMFGRDFLLLPEGPGEREGVALVILLAEGVVPSVVAPAEVATGGTLGRPLKSFSLE